MKEVIVDKSRFSILTKLREKGGVKGRERKEKEKKRRGGGMGSR